MIAARAIALAVRRTCWTRLRYRHRYRSFVVVVRTSCFPELSLRFAEIVKWSSSLTLRRFGGSSEGRNNHEVIGDGGVGDRSCSGEEDFLLDEAS